MIPLSHLSFAQGGQVKCLPKKKVIIKVIIKVSHHSVVVLWPKGQCVCGGGVLQRPSGMTGISAISSV